MLNKCPNCKKLIKYTNENKFRPFCSEKCKLIDFGAWASEEFKISRLENAINIKDITIKNKLRFGSEKDAKRREKIIMI